MTQLLESKPTNFVILNNCVFVFVLCKFTDIRTNCPTVCLISSAGICSVSGDLRLFVRSITTLNTKALLSGTNGSAAGAYLGLGRLGICLGR